jgi:DNA-directed RNA polymerase subunit RPC12/RpoP
LKTGISGYTFSMESKCPGQDIRNLKSAMYKCPSCGAEVEMFSDELRIKCKNCGAYVYKEEAPSCIEWCPQARQCLGEGRWLALKEAREVKDKGKK